MQQNLVSYRVDICMDIYLRQKIFSMQEDTVTAQKKFRSNCLVFHKFFRLLLFVIDKKR